MSYLSPDEVQILGNLLKTFFSLPYSTDLDGKDAETLIRIVKGSTGPRSKRKELFDIIDGISGYSVKTLSKSPRATRVDLQEQRFCDVEEVRKMRSENADNAAAQGHILLTYMHDRIHEQMTERNITTAKSLILLKDWNEARTEFNFVYWEEDFIGFVNNLKQRNEAGEIDWVMQDAGLHARDKNRLVHKYGRMNESPEPIRLLRMHYKHNQIFTDHDIPLDANKISFNVNQLSWDKLIEMIAAHETSVVALQTQLAAELLQNKDNVSVTKMIDALPKS